MHKVALCKLVSLSVLFLLFTFLFGLPSLAKYKAGGLTEEHSTVRSKEGNLLPAITVCPYHDKLAGRTPWINATAAMDNPEEILVIECNKSTGRDMLACIRAKTYSRKEQIIAEVFLERDPNRKESTWSSFYAGGVRGICHTLEHLQPIGSNLYTDSLKLILNPNISYDIFLHDPIFFWPTINPTSIPNAKISILEGPQGDGVQILFMEVTQHNKLNSPSCPCVLDFGECVAAFMTSIQIDDNSTTTEILSYDEILTRMTFATKDEIVKISGCQRPCESLEYKLVGGKPDTIRRDHGFIIAFTSTDMSVLTEVRLQS